MAEKIEFQLSISKNDLSAALSNATAEAKNTEKAVFRLSDAFGSARSELSAIKASFLGNLGANVVAGAFSLLKSSIGDVITQAREYSKAIAEVNSILPKNAKLTEDQAKAFIALSSQYGKTTQSEAKAFYEIVSGGVEDTTTAFKILRQANEASVAGLTDVNVAAKILTSTFNAFAQQGVSVAQITDALFQAVKDGQTTFEELSGTLGRVSPIAASVGISINEVAGTIAFLTKSGIQTDQAITGLRAAIAAVIKPSSDAAAEAQRLGIAFGPQAIKNAGGFAEFLDQVRVAANGNSQSIAKLFSDVNAINTVISITKGNFADFNKTLDNNSKSLGATASAAKELKNSFDFKAGQAEQTIKNLGLAFSVFLLPALQTTLTGFKALTGLANKSIELDENRKKLKDLADEYNNVKASIEIYNKGLGATAQETLFATSTIRSRAEGERRLNEILKERQKIRLSLIAQKEPTVKPVVTEDTNIVTDNERKLQNDLLTIKKEGAANQQAIALELANQQNILAKENFASQQEIELQQATLKAQAAYDAEVLKNNATLSGKELALANDIAFQKKKDKINDANTKKEIADAKGQLAFNQLVQQQKNAILQQGFAFAASIAKDGSKEQFYIQKAGALANVAIARGQAIAAIPAQVAAIPYPANLAAAAQLTTYANIQAALGAGIVAASAIKGFADGGIVGATRGADNQLATVRTGEMVLNADQQKKLFDMINSGYTGGDIVVQIDGREIARAVRNQERSGYRFA